ncbi:MAG: hypothetical protein ABI564_08660 [Ideonella sp.]
MNRFAWLMRREWMQHHRGWLILAVVPAVIALAVVPFGSVQVDEVIGAPMLAAMASTIYLMALLSIALVGVMFDAPGLARRDRQDRSIEFWLSLPTGHAQSIAATILTNLFLMPLVVLLISALVAPAVAALVVVKVLGAPALSEIGLPGWIGFGLLVLLREAIGLLLSLLWLSPLIMLAMAASSWLKGWGVPAVAAAIGLAALAQQQLTGQKQIWETVLHWWHQSNEAALPLIRSGVPFKALANSDDAMSMFGRWMLHDTGQLLRDAPSPAFAVALLVAALGFWVLVWRRSQGR